MDKFLAVLLGMNFFLVGSTGRADTSDDDGRSLDMGELCVRVFDGKGYGFLDDLTPRNKKSGLDSPPRRLIAPGSVASGRILLRQTESYRQEDGSVLDISGQKPSVLGHYQVRFIRDIDVTQEAKYLTGVFSPLLTPSGKSLVAVRIEKRIIEVDSVNDPEIDYPKSFLRPRDPLAKESREDESFVTDLATDDELVSAEEPEGSDDEFSLFDPMGEDDAEENETQIIQTVLEVSGGNLGSMLQGSAQTNSVRYILESFPYRKPKTGEPSPGISTIHAGIVEVNGKLSLIVEICKNGLSAKRDLVIIELSESIDGSLTISEHFKPLVNQSLDTGFEIQNKVYFLERSALGTVGYLEFIESDDYARSTSSHFSDAANNFEDPLRGRLVSLNASNQFKSDIEGNTPIQIYPFKKGRIPDSPMIGHVRSTGHFLVWEWPSPPPLGRGIVGLTEAENALIQRLSAAGTISLPKDPQTHGLVPRPLGQPFMYLVDFKSGQKIPISGAEHLEHDRGRCSVVVIKGLRAWYAMNDGWIVQLDLKDKKFVGKIELKSPAGIDDMTYDEVNDRLVIVHSNGYLEQVKPLVP